MIKTALKYFGFSLIFWMVFFNTGRLFFLIYNTHDTLLSSHISSIFYHAFRLDLASAFYLILPLFVFWILSLFTPLSNMDRALKLYFILLIPILSFITIVDLEIYRLWGVKLNAQALSYLRYPKEVLASSESSPLVFLLLLWGGLSALFIWLSELVVNRIKNSLELASGLSPRSIFRNGVMGFAGIIILVIGLRGGIQLAPVNQSFAYFSDQPFHNHASMNTIWNLVYSYTRPNGKNVYSFFPQEKAKARFDALFKGGVNDPIPEILILTRPNIVLVLLEGFSSEIFAAMGGNENLTPHLDRWVGKGLLFDRIYATGNRTDRGLVSILSGFPSQPKTSIIKEPSKTESLPAIPKQLREVGYNTAFYYGGEAEFANIKSYLFSAGFDTIIDKNNFSPTDMNSKWGAHDHTVFEKVLSDLPAKKEPFFTTILTLSSHEPFDVPMETVVEGNDRRSLYKNSVVYTDRSVGKFMEKVQDMDFYRNTVFVFISDHGYHLQEGNTYRWPRHYHIPFFITGEPLKGSWRGKQISKIGSQLDLSATLLPQLDLDASPFTYSKNLLNPNPDGFAYYSINEGFGWIAENQNLIFDYPANHTTFFNKSAPDTLNQSAVHNGKAFLQILYGDYLGR